MIVLLVIKSIYYKCVSAGINDKFLQGRVFVHNREHNKRTVHGSDSC